MKKFKQRVEAFFYVIFCYLPKKLYCKMRGGDCALRIVASDGEVLWDLGPKAISNYFDKM